MKLSLILTFFICFTLSVLFSLSGCTAGNFAKLRSLGTAARVTCYSGGKAVYDNYSVGIVASEPRSDGWYFSEKGTNDLVMVTGTCVIRHNSI